MKEIILTSNKKEIVINSILLYYLYEKFFLYVSNKNYSLDENISLNNIDDIKELYDLLNQYLIQILQKWYKEPDEKEVQKYSTRFEKIKLKNKIFKIDYRMSEIGRLIYLMNNLLQMLEVAYNNAELINIKFIDKY